MPYSAVTQPRPAPRMNGGTRSSTQAVQITCVSPNSTSTEPAACFVKRRVKRTLRSSSGTRPLGRLGPVMQISLFDTSDTSNERSDKIWGATVMSSAGADYNRRGAVECATECVRGPSMVRSMTAFARVDVPLDSGSLQWEIRSVNHRHLEPQFRLPDAFRELEFPLRDLIRSKLKRGKVDSTLRFVAAAPSAHLEINRPVLLHLLATIEQLRRDTPEAGTSRSARVVALARRARRIAARCAGGERQGHRWLRARARAARRAPIARRVDARRFDRHQADRNHADRRGSAHDRRRRPR